MFRICLVLVLCILPVGVVAEVTGEIRVIDADTIDVAGTRVRLHAIDAPEMDQNCDTREGVSFACGKWATGQVRTQFEGKVARCTPRDVDKYGRIVAQCRVNGADMGEVIVSEGWAFAFRRFGMEYDLTEKAAFVAGRGLHGVNVQPPSQFRAAKNNGTCMIKGNISKNGHIFHVPGQEFYQKTNINTARGERWFCSASEARAAGWRAARN